MEYISILFCLAAAIAAVSATDYCSSSICSPGETHVACGNSGSFASNCPSDAAMVNIDDNLKATIVKAHNTKRNLIAGGTVAKYKPACRMATMEWDDELASLAVYNVKKCVMKHDQCQNTDKFKSAGQNLFIFDLMPGVQNDTSMFLDAVERWYDEEANGTMEFINTVPAQYDGPVIGHFTVMVADRNIRVGCAASTFSEAGAELRKYLMCCNYASTNMRDFPIYVACDKATTNCTTGTNPDYPNLCSSSEVYDINKWY